jgi:hypothetical protein
MFVRCTYVLVQYKYLFYDVLLYLLLDSYYVVLRVASVEREARYYPATPSIESTRSNYYEYSRAA